MISRSFFLVLCAHFSGSAKILGIFPSKLSSHGQVLLPLLDELHSRGHSVTVASFFPRQGNVTDYRSIGLSYERIASKGFLTLNNFTGGYSYIYNNMKTVKALQAEYPEVVTNPEVKALQQEHFDLIITEYFNTELFLGLIYRIGAPFILFHTTEPLPWHRDSLREPLESSFMPHIFNCRPRSTSFVERFMNTLELQGILAYYEYYLRPPTQSLARRHFGDIPQLDNLVKRASMFFVNTHFSLHGDVPKSSTTVEVGGIHLKQIKPLPNDIQQILDKSLDGVIYFSLGSLLKGSSLPEDITETILNVFQALNQTVLWKWEGILNNKSKNVHSAPWFPQRDILGHPNVVLFISHCGLLGTYEALDSAVPLLCLPIFADQPFNSRLIESRGIGLSLELEKLTTADFNDAIIRLIKNPKFKRNAQKMSNAFKDRPLTPLDTAVYWSEYVIRHNGADHLRSAGRNLSWVEYHNVDVLLTLVIAGLIWTYVSLRVALTLGRGLFYRLTSSPRLKLKVK